VRGGAVEAARYARTGAAGPGLDRTEHTAKINLTRASQPYVSVPLVSPQASTDTGRRPAHLIRAEGACTAPAAGRPRARPRLRLRLRPRLRSRPRRGGKITLSISIAPLRPAKAAHRLKPENGQPSSEESLLRIESLARGGNLVLVPGRAH